MYTISYETDPRNNAELDICLFLSVLSAVGYSALMTYRDEVLHGTGREIRPERVWRSNAGHLLITGHCFLRNETRTFRVDRLASIAAGNELPDETPRLTDDELFLNQAREHVESLGISLEGTEVSLSESQGTPHEAFFWYIDNPDRSVSVKMAWWDENDRRAVGMVVQIVDHP